MGNGEDKPKSKFMVFEDDNQSSDYKQIKTEVKKMCKCSWKVRLITFTVCCVIGWLLSILAIIAYLAGRGVGLFAVLYCLGQLTNLTGTCFLAGPAKQFSNMTDPKRLIVSVLYVSSTVATILFAVLLPHLPVLTIVSFVVSVVSYFLYSLSYIPYGQQMLKKACSCCVSSVAGE